MLVQAEEAQDSSQKEQLLSSQKAAMCADERHRFGNTLLDTLLLFGLQPPTYFKDLTEVVFCQLLREAGESWPAHG